MLKGETLLTAVPPGTPKSEILGLNFGHLTANISKTVSRSVTCQLEINIRELSKTVSHGAVVPQQIPQIPNLPTPVWRVLCYANALVKFYRQLRYICQIIVNF